MNHSPELSTAQWRSSSYSNASGGECVQVSDDFPGLVPVRDSKNPTGPALTVRAPAWSAFISSVK
ncbi:DUF397 domain-containing protein [Streptomyces sp. SID8356]|uniref:DUF397 domain-containing protein n=1 Tax=unclassified Streptomyces TaxID=2593676 RepID=UPI000367E861|nr:MULTISPECIES: DUF397 domain-containing protein [unclassified Streptomyces]MYT36305.1 DUF397 domain-containing protein [Streptomyces sp. SID8356]